MFNVSVSATDNSYIPFKSVLVPMAVPTTLTVPNSIGLSSLSTTFPEIFTLSEKHIKIFVAINDNSNMYLFISTIK